jgi:hypothetical protein
MRFLIRDDDTCAYTKPEELVRCYARIWDHQPVGLAVTPFRIPGDFAAVPASHRGGTEPLPLEGNAELVAFLKEQLARSRIEVLLHGYHHTKPRGLPEYVGETDLRRKTRQGKAYLEDLLQCRIDTFVPPNNEIGREGLEAVIACGLNLVNVPPLLRPSRRRLRLENVPNFLKVRYYRAVKKMRFPHVLRFADHSEVDYYAVTASQRLEDLVDGFINCHRESGVFVAAVHYHAFASRLPGGETVGQALAILLDLASKDQDVRPSRFADLWQA